MWHERKKTSHSSAKRQCRWVHVYLKINGIHSNKVVVFFFVIIHYRCVKDSPTHFEKWLNQLLCHIMIFAWVWAICQLWSSSATSLAACCVFSSSLSFLFHAKNWDDMKSLVLSQIFLVRTITQKLALLSYCSYTGYKLHCTIIETDISKTPEAAIIG